MSSSKRNAFVSDRKVKPIKVNFSDLDKLQVLLPPHLTRLGINLTISFDNGVAKVGFMKPGFTFDHPIEEVQRLGQVPMIVSAIKPQEGVRQAASLVASLAPATEPKFVPEVGGVLIQVQKFLKNIDDLEKVVETRVKSGYMHDEAKVVLQRIIPIIRAAIRNTVQNVSERKKFSDQLEAIHFPKEVANRLVGGTINFAQNDLIRAFYPSDPSKHLSFSITEMLAGAPELFKEVLSKPARMCLDYFRTQRIADFCGSIAEELKILEYRITTPSPLPLKEVFRSRSKRPIGSFTNDPYRTLWTHNCVFLYPQWLATGGIGYDAKALASDLLNVNPANLPTDMKGWEDLIPEGKSPQITAFNNEDFVRKMFRSFALDAWADNVQEHKGERKVMFDYPSLKEYEIKADEKKAVKLTPKVPRIMAGNFRLGKVAKELCNDIHKLRPDMVGLVKNFLTNFSSIDMQEKAVNALYARLETGVDQESAPFGADADDHEGDHEHDD